MHQLRTSTIIVLKAHPVSSHGACCALKKTLLLLEPPRRTWVTRFKGTEGNQHLSKKRDSSTSSNQNSQMAAH